MNVGTFFAGLGRAGVSLVSGAASVTRNILVGASNILPDAGVLGGIGDVVGNVFSPGTPFSDDGAGTSVFSPEFYKVGGGLTRGLSWGGRAAGVSAPAVKAVEPIPIVATPKTEAATAPATKVVEAPTLEDFSGSAFDFEGLSLKPKAAPAAPATGTVATEVATVPATASETSMLNIERMSRDPGFMRRLNSSNVSVRAEALKEYADGYLVDINSADYLDPGQQQSYSFGIRQAISALDEAVSKNVDGSNISGVEAAATDLQRAIETTVIPTRYAGQKDFFPTATRSRAELDAGLSSFRTRFGASGEASLSSGIPKGYSKIVNRTTKQASDLLAKADGYFAEGNDFFEKGAYARADAAFRAGISLITEADQLYSDLLDSSYTSGFTKFDFRGNELGTDWDKVTGIGALLLPVATTTLQLYYTDKTSKDLRKYESREAEKQREWTEEQNALTRESQERMAEIEASAVRSPTSVGASAGVSLGGAFTAR